MKARYQNQSVQYPAMRALAVDSGDETITEAFFLDCNAIDVIGAKPVFVDISEGKPDYVCDCVQEYNA